MNLIDAAKLSHSDWQERAAGTKADIDNAKDKCFDSLLSYTNSKATWFRLN